MHGEQEVKEDHLEILSHVLWDDPIDQPKAVETIVGKIANPIGQKVHDLQIEAEQIVASVDMKQVSTLLEAMPKLENIGNELAKLPSGNGRLKKVQEYVSARQDEMLAEYGATLKIKK